MNVLKYKEAKKYLMKIPCLSKINNEYVQKNICWGSRPSSGYSPPHSSPQQLCQSNHLRNLLLCGKQTRKRETDKHVQVSDIYIESSFDRVSFFTKTRHVPANQSKWSSRNDRSLHLPGNTSKMERRNWQVCTTIKLHIIYQMFLCL